MWDELFSGEMSEEKARPEIERIAKEFSAGLRDRPEIVADIRELFARQLSNPDAGTLQELWSASRVLVGEEAAGLLSWGMNTLRDDEDAALLTGQDSEDSMGLVRTLYALHRTDFQTAWSRSGELPNDWQTIDADFFDDLTRNRHRIAVRLTQYSGEVTLLEGDLNSFLNLSSALNRMLRSIDAREEFLDSAVEEYTDATTQMLTLLHGEELAAEDAEETEETGETGETGELAS